MCGINGIYAYRTGAATVDREELLRTRDHMRSRGPDGCGDWLSPDRRVGLGHRRLAIIDLSDAGAQPMSTPDGRLHVTFNGEIYNYRELRAELAAQGVASPEQHATPRCCCTSTAATAPGSCSGCAACSRSRSGTRSSGGSSSRATRYGIKPLYYADDGTARSASPRRSRRCSRAARSRANSTPPGSPASSCGAACRSRSRLPAQIRALPAGCTLTVDRSGSRAAAAVLRPRRRVSRRSCAAADGIQPRRRARTMLRAALADSVRAHWSRTCRSGRSCRPASIPTTIVGLAQSAAPRASRPITLDLDEFSGTRNDEAPLAAEDRCAHSASRTPA